MFLSDKIICNLYCHHILCVIKLEKWKKRKKKRTNVVRTSTWQILEILFMLYCHHIKCVQITKSLHIWIECLFFFLLFFFFGRSCAHIDPYDIHMHSFKYLLLLKTAAFIVCGHIVNFTYHHHHCINHSHLTIIACNLIQNTRWYESHQHHLISSSRNILVCVYVFRFYAIQYTFMFIIIICKHTRLYEIWVTVIYINYAIY